MKNNLNLLEKLQKQRILKRLTNFQTYKNIKNPNLKKDSDIIEKAWKLAKSEDYIEFPESFQSMKAKDPIIRRNILPHTSYNVQIQFLKENEENLKYCNQEIQLQYCLNELKAKELLRDLSEQIQIMVAKENSNLIPYCKDKVQKDLVEENYHLIQYCNIDIQKELLKTGNSELWKSYQETASYETFKNMINSTIFNNRKLECDCMSMFLNSKKGKELNDILKIAHYYDISSFTKYCDLTTQNQIYEYINSLENSDYNNLTIKNGKINYEIFSNQFIEDKIKEIYGNKKYEDYQELWSIINNSGYNNITNYIISLFLEKSTIIEKISPEKVINFLKYYYVDNKMKYLSQAYHYNDFFDIIKEAYGKEALQILKERPGLNFEHIDNLEIFSQEVLNNFRKGFIHDLLSYDFKENIIKFIRIVKNPSDLNAFKLYYSRFSNKFGSKAEIMDLCISRYQEYKNVLQEATTTELTQEQLEKLDTLCAWPKNIAEIKSLEDLANLEQKLQEKMKYLIENNIQINLSDIFDVNLHAERVIYNYNNSIKKSENITEHEQKTLLFFENLQYNNQFVFNEKFNQILSEPKFLSHLFVNKYTAITKIKNDAMRNFQTVVTGRKEIEKNIEEGKYGVKRVIIDGLEVIDLGEMPTNFAVHNPNMDNSDVREKDIQDEYLTYEGRNGISTISAIGKTSVSAREDRNNHIAYVYWDFSNNEIIALYDSAASDAMVSHEKKMIKSSAWNSNSILEQYQDLKNVKEIAFYRRYRDHNRIENTKYGGKIIPDAIIGDPHSPEIIKIALERFEKSIPILCERGSLSKPDYVAGINNAIYQYKYLNPRIGFDNTEDFRKGHRKH